MVKGSYTGDIQGVKLKSNQCRVCLEEATKVYPLEGSIANVDINISTMITFCTSVEVEISDDFPDGVCVPCFRTIRIAYNFILQFRESNKKLLEERVKHDKARDQELQEPSVNMELATKITDLQQIIDYEESTKNWSIAHREERNLMAKEPEDHQEVEDVEQIIFGEEMEKTEYEEEEDGDEVFRNPENPMEDLEASLGITESTQSRLLKQENIYENFDGQKAQKLIILSNNKSDHLYCDTVKTEETDSYVSRKKITKRFVCPKCPHASFTGYGNGFMHHILLKHQHEIFNCNMCNTKVNFDTDAFLKHFTETHRYQCPFCGKSYLKKGTHNAHLKTHSNIRYPCTFKDCTKSFVTQWSLKKHLESHNPSISYECTECRISCTSYDNYRYHLKKHDIPKHLCTFCGRTFLQSVHLKYHMWVHTGVKQFKCDLCSKSYTSVTQMKKHKRRHHT